MSTIDENVDDFFNEDVAVDAIYTPAGGQPSSVSVILDRPYSEINPFGNTGIESRQIFITVKTTDFDGCAQGEIVEINSVEYYIINPQMDIGISRIQLSLDDPYES